MPTSTDSFNRQNSSSLGPDWTSKRNSFSIQDSSAAVTTAISDDYIMYYNKVLPGVSSFAQITLSTTLYSTAAAGVNQSTTVRTGYYGGHDFLNFGTYAVIIYKANAVFSAPLTTHATWTASASATYRLESYLNTVSTVALQLYVNGTSVLTYIDTTATLSSAATRRVGMMMFNPSTNLPGVDTWSGGDLNDPVGGPQARIFMYGSDLSGLGSPGKFFKDKL